MFPARRLIGLPLALVAAACGGGDEGALDIALIGTAEGPFESGVRLSTAGQHVRAATTEGLVGLDPHGQVMPALAERWIVTEDGSSYIFRLRDAKWADGTDVTAQGVERELRRVIRRLAGTSLGLDLDQVAEIRAMAQRVVEIRLKGPVPDFLQLLAQPELGLTKGGKGSGPMVLAAKDGSGVLTMTSPESRGLPQEEGWQDHVRELTVHGLPAEQAIARFYDGEADVVIGGRIETLPLVKTAPLSRSYAQADAALGLFGLMVRRGEGFLDSPERREAIAMAIDRDGLMAPFNLGGWIPTTRLVAGGLTGDLGTIGERWAEMSLAARWETAGARVAAWKAEAGVDTVELTIELPEGPGSDLLFETLSGDLSDAGITLVRTKPGERGQLYLFDRVARYAAARWFLNQFNCSLRVGICSEDADMLVREAIVAPDAAERAALLAEAEAELTRLNVFIPLGQPVRWSLVRAGVTGYEPNPWGFHSLSAMAEIPR
jgi:oligopeptide transport system substrate-binding protein